ncbi:TetR/AcrR family transcriptional regulator [Nocardioides campestrisoli]|uniref:TetR/AcrR family transcriptional regulator n=1 Tax=Nocardioides campestrisoli TaxID=2736757 RepID=UPI0015E7E2F9|nr:TetR/AcrR family transcriptional regulator [Nocardioides campestrisoli]
MEHDGAQRLEARLARAAGLDPRKDPYLDAAHACILDVGWRRTTLTEVARRAGVSRMTIYRAWPDMGALMGDLMAREWGAVVATSTLTGSIADGAVAVVEHLRRNPLFRRIVELDPELLLPYLLARRGRSQQAILEALTDRIAEHQARGAVRDGDPAAIARAMLLLGHGFVLSLHTMVDEQVAEEALMIELHELVERHLAPVALDPAQSGIAT